MVDGELRLLELLARDGAAGEFFDSLHGRLLAADVGRGDRKARALRRTFVARCVVEDVPHGKIVETVGYTWPTLKADLRAIEACLDVRSRLRDAA